MLKRRNIGTWRAVSLPPRLRTAKGGAEHMKDQMQNLSKADGKTSKIPEILFSCNGIQFRYESDLRPLVLSAINSNVFVGSSVCFI